MEKIILKECLSLFYIHFYLVGGELVTPIDLFKAGVTFGVSIYVYAKKNINFEK